MDAIELNGKYSTAKVYATTMDNGVISQLIGILNLESSKGSNIAVMPDCHPGKGCVIGTTMTLSDSVIPNLVGVDIGCGVLAIKLKEERIKLPDLDSVIHKNIAYDNGVHDTPVASFDISDLRCIANKGRLRVELAQKSIGTLGGGNHFIEVDVDSEGNNWLLIHTGSRHLGIEVCDHYQKLAYSELKTIVNNGTFNSKQQALIDRLKVEGRQSEISKEIEKFRKNYTEIKPSTPFELAACTGQLMDDYIHDMKIVQAYAVNNRRMIANIIIKKMKLHEVDSIDTIHNYIDTEHMVLRKGAVSAQSGERLIIPMNMRDGSFLCIGKGNPDWNYSAPHGAGRLYSRAEAKSLISVTDYKKTMKEAGIFSTSVGKDTVDESPMAYKDFREIQEIIQDTVEIVQRITPIYNFKAGGKE